MIQTQNHIIRILSVLFLLTVWNESIIAQEKQPVRSVTQAATNQEKKIPEPDYKQLILKDPTVVPSLLKQGKLTTDKIPDPHWKENTCITCHKSKKGAGLKNLRHSNVDKLCNTCHESLSAHDYIHVSDIKIPSSMSSRMPGDFRSAVKRGDKKMTCITCHDLPMTCEKKRKNEKRLNPMFFRGGPYKSRTGICYKCHDVDKYKRVNAHDQINEKGVLQEDKCLICHTRIPKNTMADTSSDMEYNLKDNLSRLCWGCHPWKPHPGGSFSFFSGGMPNHLVKPSEQILERMREKEKQHNVVFPLEPGTGKVFCATCHNPHERGVIKDKGLARGADSRLRLRKQDICENCHNK